MELIVAIAILVGFILAIRLLGAWMLRINDVIKYQHCILSELLILNKNIRELTKTIKKD